MTLSQLINLIRWDMRVNRIIGFDSIRAKLLLIEVRLEQYVHRKTHQHHNILTTIIWYVCRAFGSIYQWFLCNSSIPGSTTIGRGLRLPHPQNIIIFACADIGEYCTIYQNVSISWNGFKRPVPLLPKIGDRVLVGGGAIIIGDITIGSDVLIGAGAVVAQSIPSHSRVTCAKPNISPRFSSAEAAEPGSEQHLKDPFSIWR